MDIKNKEELIEILNNFFIVEGGHPDTTLKGKCIRTIEEIENKGFQIIKK